MSWGKTNTHQIRVCTNMQWKSYIVRFLRSVWRWKVLGYLYEWRHKITTWLISHTFLSTTNRFIMSYSLGNFSVLITNVLWTISWFRQNHWKLAHYYYHVYNIHVIKVRSYLSWYTVCYLWFSIDYCRCRYFISY